MENTENTLPINTARGERLSFIVCRNSHGIELRGTLHRLTRYLAVFEVYNPYSIVQLSEVLSDFRIMMNERMIYSGRAIVGNLVNTGIMLICETSLSEEGWIDVGIFSTVYPNERLQNDLQDFLKETAKNYQVLPEFKVVVSDMQILLSDLRRWMEQVELGMRSMPSTERLQAERDALMKLDGSILPAMWPLMNRFEDSAAGIPTDLQPVHRSFAKRQLHPLVLCSPFTYRTYQKPLGYAGDYEMVGMMLRDPYEGSSIFAKMLNRAFLESPTVVAHRNRIVHLSARLEKETQRVASEGRPARIFNLGCGPAQEVQNFLAHEEVSDKADFLLLDFNDETLSYTTRTLKDLQMRYKRQTSIKFERKSVQQVLKDSTRSARSESSPRYDFVYCAGLFDYLSDRVCRRLLQVFYEMVAPGGLVLATNVHVRNPSKHWMECVMDWHLVYRDEQQFRALADGLGTEDAVSIECDPTGVNIFLEIRKPLDG